MRAKEPVEQGKLLRQGCNHRKTVGCKHVDNITEIIKMGIGMVCPVLVVNEPLHCGSRKVTVGRGLLTKDFFGGCQRAVVGIARVNEGCVVAHRNVWRVWVAGVERVGFFSRQTVDVERWFGALSPSKDMVKGAVLFHEDDDVFYFATQEGKKVGSGGRRKDWLNGGEQRQHWQQQRSSQVDHF